MQESRHAFSQSMKCQALQIDERIINLNDNLATNLTNTIDSAKYLRIAKIKGSKLNKSIDATIEDPTLAWLHKVKEKKILKA